MSDVWGEAIVEAFRDMMMRMALFLPKLLALTSFIVLGILAAVTTRAVLHHLLRAARVDVLSERWGLQASLAKAGIKQPFSQVVGRLAFWTVFVIFVCSLWPVLINTAFGVRNVHKDYINVAQTLELSRLRTAFTIILPAAAPTILTGMRISIGISWLVIVAAEMLVGGTGIGYYVWNEWNNLDLASVIFSILVIGVVGLGLDSLIGGVARRVSYES